VSGPRRAGPIGPGGGPADTATVVVTRARHPLAGQQLRVLGRMRRHGRLELLVVLPDGSKSLLPAAWTDREPAAMASDGATSDGAAQGAGPATLGSLADLAHAAAVVAALLAGVGGQREQAARQSPCEEDNRAAHPAQSAPGPGSGATGQHHQRASGAGRRGRVGGTGPLDRPRGQPAPRQAEGGRG
jgi:Family of unknown function (DUF5372)